MPKKIAISAHQGRLPLGHRRPGAAFTLERRLILIAGFLVVLVAIAYAYFIVASVSHAAAREGLARENAALASDVAALESQYLSQGSAITESYARSLGYVTPGTEVFLTRSAGTLSFRDAR